MQMLSFLILSTYLKGVILHICINFLQNSLFAEIYIIRNATCNNCYKKGHETNNRKKNDKNVTAKELIEKKNRTK